MTREEELNKYLKERNIPVDSLEANSIREGVNWVIETIKLSDCNPKTRPCMLTNHGIDTNVVKWADENPKEGLVSIDKVCEYLKSLVYQEFGGGPLERTFSDEDIEDFRKAMEG